MNEIASANQADDGLIVVRAAELEDESFLEKLYLQVRRDEFAEAGLDDFQLETLLKMQFQMQKRAYKMQFPDAVGYIVEYDKTPAGRLIVERGEREIRLVDISLLEDFRNRGLGAVLIEDLKSEAAAREKPLRLRVLKTNEAAKRFYDRTGFTIIENADLFFMMEWRSL